MYKRKSSPTSYNNRPYKRPRTTTSTQSVAAVVKKELDKTKDKRYWPVNVGSTSITTSGVITSPTASLVRGDRPNEYEGNKLNIEWLRIRYLWNSTTTSYNCVRVLIFQWLDSSVPTPSSILSSVGSSSAPLAPTVIQNKPYIRVLHDNCMAINVLDSAGGTSGYVRTVFIKGSRLLPVKYQTGADVVHKNNIYVLAISDDTVTDWPDFQYFSELCFT